MKKDEIIKAFTGFIEQLKNEEKEPEKSDEISSDIKRLKRICEHIVLAAKDVQRVLSNPNLELLKRLEAIEASCQAHQLGLQNVHDKFANALAEREIREFVYMKIEHLDIATRTKNCLTAENIHTIETLCGWCELCLMRTPNLGRKSVRELQDVLARKYYKFANEYNCIAPIHKIKAVMNEQQD